MTEEPGHYLHPFFTLEALVTFYLGGGKKDFPTVENISSPIWSALFMVRVFLAQFTRLDLWIGPAIGLKSNVRLRKKKERERFLCMSCFSWKLWKRSFPLYFLGIFRYTYVEIIGGTLKKPFAFIDASSSTIYLVFLCAYSRSDVSRC